MSVWQGACGAIYLWISFFSFEFEYVFLDFFVISTQLQNESTKKDFDLFPFLFTFWLFHLSYTKQFDLVEIFSKIVSTGTLLNFIFVGHATLQSSIGRRIVEPFFIRFDWIDLPEFVKWNWFRMLQQFLRIVQWPCLFPKKKTKKETKWSTSRDEKFNLKMAYLVETWRVNRFDADTLQTQCNDHVVGRRFSWTRTRLRQVSYHVQTKHDTTTASYVIESVRKVQLIAVPFAQINVCFCIKMLQELQKCWHTVSELILSQL